MIVAGRPTALVVDDELVIALDIKRTLEARGYRVPATARTGPDALLAAQSFPPEIVLMDLRLTGPMDGIATALSLREQFEFALVYVTGGGIPANDRDQARLRTSEPDGWLGKPFSATELERVAANALEHRASRLAIAR